jgi:WD40 repeat protein
MSIEQWGIDMGHIVAVPVTEKRGGSPAPGLPPTPYPGLRPFDQEEWPIFFGRERITCEMIDRLSTAQIIVIHGASGCGKSSFVRAGILAQLARQCAREGWQWQTAEMRPGSSPLWNLAEALARIKYPNDDCPPIEQVRSVRKQLNIGRAAFARIAEDLHLGPKRQVCILLDQFEELFRFVEEIGLDEAELFAEIMCGFADAPPEGIHLVVTVRSDHLGDFSQFHGLAEVVNRSQYLLPRLSDDDLIRAIREPVTLYNGEVKLDVAMKLLRDSDGDLDALPLIQHCLMRMWQKVASSERSIDLHHYHGLRQGLSAHADEVFGSVTDVAATSSQKSVFERGVEAVFCALTAIDTNGRYIRRPQTFGRLLDVTGIDSVSLNKVLRPFRAKDVGFLTPRCARDLEEDEVVDISHEALIRHWIRLSGSPTQIGWIQTEAKDGQRYRALLEIVPGPLPLSAAAKWLEWWQRCPRTSAWAARYGGQFEQVSCLMNDTKRRRVLLRAAAIILGGLLIFSSIYGAFKYGHHQDSEARRQAQQQFQTAQKARAISLAAIGEQTLMRDGATQALLIAIEGLKGAGGALSFTPAQTLPIIPQTEKLAYRALRELREEYIIPGERFSAPLVSFSPNSDFLMIGRSGGNVQLFNTKTGATVANEKIEGVKRLVAMKWIAEKENGSVLLVEQDEKRMSSVLVLHPCSEKAADVGFDCARSGPRSLGSASKVLASSNSLRTVSPDGQYLLSGGFGAADTRLWSARDQRVVDVQLQASVNSTFNSDTSAFALGLSDRVVVYDMKTFSPREFTAEEMTGPGWRMTALALGPKNTSVEGKLFTATMGVARLWDLGTKQSQVLPRPQSSTSQAIFSPTGDSVAAVLDNGGVQVWHWLPGGHIISFVLLGHKGLVISIDFSRDGQLIATGSKDGTARVWRVRSVLAPEVSMASAHSNEAPESHSFESKVLENNKGVLSVRDQVTGEPLVVLNKKPRKWETYSFVSGGVSAIAGDRRYFWKIFSGAAELSAFAQDHLPICDGKRLSLTPQHRAILLGIPDPSPTSSPDARVEGGQRTAQESNCYPLPDTEGFYDE